LFQFSLQRILDYRRQIRERIEYEMEAIHNKLYSEKRALESCHQELESWAHSLQESKSGPIIDLAEITLIYNYMETLEQRALQHEKIIHGLNHELEQKRKEYVAASMAEKIMDKLKTKEWTIFLDAVNKHERTLLDEVAGRSHWYGDRE
jgi:flagellar protein FliJ